MHIASSINFSISIFSHKTLQNQNEINKKPSLEFWIEFKDFLLTQPIRIQEPLFLSLRRTESCTISMSNHGPKCTMAHSSSVRKTGQKSTRQKRILKRCTKNAPFPESTLIELIYIKTCLNTDLNTCLN